MDYPSDALWSDTLINVLNSFAGISNVTIDITNNKITITNDCTKIQKNCNADIFINLYFSNIFFTIICFIYQIKLYYYYICLNSVSSIKLNLSVILKNF